MPTEKLPVIATGVEAMKLPLIQWREFLRFGGILIAIKFILTLISALAVTNSSSALNQRFPLWLLLLLLPLILAISAAVVPFAVAWTRLTVNGPAAISHRPIWTFSRTERGYLIAALLLPLITIAPSLLVFGVALVLSSHDALMITLIIIAVALFVGGWGCYVRLWFILIELALQRYRGPRASWDQSRGNIWRLIGLGFVAAGPFLVGGGIFQIVGEHLGNHIVWQILASALQSLFRVVGYAAGFSALALAYELTAPAPDAAASLTS
jgi:hypothetical protein